MKQQKLALKEMYERPEVEIIIFEQSDVITNSDTGEWDPNH